MMCSSVIVGSIISRSSFVFSQSRIKIRASLINVGSPTVGAFDLVHFFLSVVGLVPVLNVCDVVEGLWATQML